VKEKYKKKEKKILIYTMEKKPKLLVSSLEFWLLHVVFKANKARVSPGDDLHRRSGTLALIWPGLGGLIRANGPDLFTTSSSSLEELLYVFCFAYFESVFHQIQL